MRGARPLIAVALLVACGRDSNNTQEEGIRRDVRTEAVGSEFGQRSLGPWGAPKGVLAHADRVGILIPFGVGDSATRCLECGEEKCRTLDTSQESVGKASDECVVRGRKILCPDATGDALFLKDQPSLSVASCTVTAIGTRHIMTAPHCVPKCYVCGEAELRKDYVVLFGYDENSLGAGVERYEIDLESEPKTYGLMPGYCKGVGAGVCGLKAGVDPEREFDEDLTHCKDTPGTSEESPAEGVIVIPLKSEHHRKSKGGIPLLCATSRSGTELWSYNHPLGAPLVTSGPSSGIVRGHKHVRADLFLEPGSSGAPVFDKAGGLEGVFYGFEGTWDYCSTSGARDLTCNDSVQCSAGDGCKYVRATIPSDSLCECLRNPSACTALTQNTNTRTKENEDGI